MPARFGVGRRVSELFFTRDGDNTNIFTCRCGTKRKKAGSSYQNLVSHVQSAHPDYLDVLSSDETVAQAQIDKYFQTSKAGNLFGWIDFIVNALLPFSFVEKPIIRDHVKYKPTSLSTFMRYLSLLTEVVEQKIARLLPEKIALVFDGWTSGTSHYLAVFASFPAPNKRGYEMRLLTMSPMGDESRLDAEEHYQFISFTLSLYNKSWKNVCCLIGDNVSTNKCLSTKAKVPFIGCASHRFNLAVRALLQDDEPLVSKIQNIMVKLRTLLLSAKLRKLTPIAPRIRNITRWSSTYEMIVRYVRLKDFLPALDSDEIDALSLTPFENRRVDTLLQQLELLESVTKVLQDDTTTMSDVRAVFDAVMDKFPETSCRLTSSAEIVHSPLFEGAIVKLQRGTFGALSREEQSIASFLATHGNRDCGDVDGELSFAHRALKRQKCRDMDSTKQFTDTRFLIPTSNVCERLFSKVGHALSDRRKGVAPVHLESQMFLHFNRDLWGSADVNKLTLN